MSSGIDPDFGAKETAQPTEGQLDITGGEVGLTNREVVEKDGDQPTVVVEERHRIDPSLGDLIVPIDSIKLHPRNARRGVVDTIADSYDRFGQLKPVVVQKSSGFIVAGNHSWIAAAEKLKWTHIAAVLSDMDDDTAEQFLLMDNRSADLGTYDEGQLAEQLEALQDRGLLDGTGYTPDDVDDILARLDQVMETAPQEFTGGYAEDPEVTQARYDPERRPDGSHIIHREFVLAYPVEVYEEFVKFVSTLRKAWGVSSARDVIFEAMRRQSLDPDGPYDENGLAQLLWQRQKEGMKPVDPEAE